MTDKERYNWYVDKEVLAWLKAEAKRLRLSYSDTLTEAVKFFKEYVELHGDDRWKP